MSVRASVRRARGKERGSIFDTAGTAEAGLGGKERAFAPGNPLLPFAPLLFLLLLLLPTTAGTRWQSQPAGLE